MVSDVHVIAYVYNWGRNEIMSLPIKTREMYAELIKQQKEAENPEESYD